jgi:hypothetical protein
LSGLPTLCVLLIAMLLCRLVKGERIGVDALGGDLGSLHCSHHQVSGRKSGFTRRS